MKHPIPLTYSAKENIKGFILGLVSILSLLLLLTACDSNNEDNNENEDTSIKGEVIENSQIKTIRVYGNNYEMGYAYGALVGKNIGDGLKNYIQYFFGKYYTTVKTIASTEGNLNISQEMRDEMQGVIDGMNYTSTNIYNLDINDLIVANSFLDLYAMLMSGNSGLGCSALMSWGDATRDSELEGKSMITRHLDWTVSAAFLDNMIMCIRIPDGEDKQPWVSIGFGGLMGSLSGINSNLAVFQNTMDDYSGEGPKLGENYTPIWLALRQAVESKDYNNDGQNNTLDVKASLDSEAGGIASAVLVSALASANNTTENIALVAELAPSQPRITYRDNTYTDSINGDNLYLANEQIARNSNHNYSERYLAMIAAVDEGINISSAKSWEFMCERSSLSHNLMTIQYIPELKKLSLSLHESTVTGKPAYMVPPTVYNVEELFNQ